MKKRIALITLLAFVASLPAPTIVVRGPVSAAGGEVCGPAADVSATSHNDEQGISGELNHWVGQSDWVAPASKKICKIEFMLTYHTGDITSKNYFATIWNRGGTTAQLGSVFTNGTSAAVAGVNSWSETVVAFSFSAPYPEVVSGTAYHITCGLAAGTTDTSNYAKVRYHTTTSSITGITGFWEDDGATPYPVRASLGTGDVYIKITYFD